ANAAKLQRSAGALAQCPHQRHTQPIAGCFGGNQKYLGHGQFVAFGGHAFKPSATPMTKIFARSAAAARCDGSATTVVLAATAMPARRAAAAASTVPGPIVGRSRRLS